MKFPMLCIGFPIFTSPLGEVEFQLGIRVRKK